MLDDFRKKIGKELYLSNSFPMIMGSGENGAIVHYRATQEGKQVSLKYDEPFLCDTGAQYLGGTTDTTRTFLFDDSNLKEDCKDIKEMYTRVLMGNLSL
jgi:Xaa-Pro aminopeptidase